MRNISRGCRSASRLALVGLACLPAGLAWAAKPKQDSAALDFKAFFKPELYISSAHAPLEAALPQMANRANWESFLLQRGEDPASPRMRVFVDARSGAVSNLIESVPLIPG